MTTEKTVIPTHHYLTLFTPEEKALLHHLFQQNIALPAYSTLQRLISFRLNQEQKRLWEICETI